MSKKAKIIIEIVIIFLLAIGLGYYIYSDYSSEEPILNSSNAEKTEQIEQIATLDFTKKDREISEEKRKEYEDDFKAAADKFINNPNGVEAFWPLIEIAQIKQLIGDYDGAKQTLIWAEELQPESYLVHGNLANLYFRHYQDFAKAEEYYLKAIEGGDPKTIPYYFELHEIYRYFYKQETSLAEDILKQGMEMHPDETDFMAVLADYYKGLSRFQESKEYYQKMLEINPDSQVAKRGLESLE